METKGTISARVSGMDVALITRLWFMSGNKELAAELVMLRKLAKRMPKAAITYAQEIDGWLGDE